jgi:hypothetical protein
VCVFTRDLSGPLASLVKQLDAAIEKDKNLKAFVVVPTDDKAKWAAALEELARKEQIKNVPLTVYEGASGPDIYQLHKEAAVTVLMWKSSKVVVNHAFRKDGLTEDKVKTVVEDVSQILK